MNLECDNHQFLNKEVPQYLPFCIQLMSGMLFTGMLQSAVANLLLFDNLLRGHSWSGSFFVLILIILFLNLSQRLMAYFDEILPWLLFFRKRLVYQFFSSLILICLSFSFTLFFFYLGIERAFLKTLMYLKITLLYILLFTVMTNLICLGCFLFRFSFYILTMYGKQTDELTKLEQQVTIDLHGRREAPCYISMLNVRFGFRVETVYIKDVVLLKASSEGRQCFTKNKNICYDFDENLDNLSQVLDPRQFCKISRRYIVNREIVRGYDVLKNRKIQLKLTDGFQTENDIMVSREQAQYFKNWFEDSR